MFLAQNWKDYEILDTSDGEKLERWGDFILLRPDPQIIWKSRRQHPRWSTPDARYRRSTSGGGSWEINSLPASWEICYKNLVFNVKPMNFKHTGVFPEQAANWDFMSGKIAAAQREISVLNLFAYTGGATLACAEAGARVCHVDAAKGMVQWASENAKSSGLAEKTVRYIVDDCIKFVQREIRRGNRYDAIVMDPPSYGRGPGGEVWKLEECLFDFVQLCAGLMSDRPLFFVINSYTTGLSPSALSYILSLCVASRFGGCVTADEIGISVALSGLALPCGATGRWEA